MLKVTERVYLVGSGSLGHELSNSRDCNVYLLDGGKECALIDAGSGIEPERIISNIEQDGLNMDRVKYLILTHYHGDHAAGAFYFHRKYGLKVIIAEEARPWLVIGDLSKASLPEAIKAGVYTEGFELPACPVFRGVAEVETIKVGDVELQVFNTPGHSRGHISLLFTDDGHPSLFAGDVIFAGGKIVLQNTWDCNIQEYAESIAKLHKLQVDRLYSGHGPFVFNHGWKHIEQAHDYFERLEVPPNL